MTQIEQSTVHNRLLAALSPDDFILLVPALHRVGLELKEVLYRPHQPIGTVYFLESGIVSMLVPLEEGRFMEVGLVGREGLAGLPAVLGADSSAIEALVQAPGTALRIQSAELRKAFEASATLRGLLLRYTQAYHAQVTQTAACNGHHLLEERLARWLLMAHDRAESDEFPMTQEFMSTMLGVRRAGVSVAASILQKAGVIGYAHGSITVLDRSGLEAATCQCYGTVQRQFEHLLGHPAENGRHFSARLVR
jgi:CRP-like cAMP-binding protein